MCVHGHAYMYMCMQHASLVLGVKYLSEIVTIHMCINVKSRVCHSLFPSYTNELSPSSLSAFLLFLVTALLIFRDKKDQ
jgi:hypothetical protein